MERITIFDRWGGYVGELSDIRSAVLTQRINGEESIDIVTATRVEKDQRLLMRDKMGAWHEFVATDPVEVHDGGAVLYSVWAEASTCELRSCYVVEKRPGVQSGASARTAMEAALSTSRWSVGNVADLGTAGVEMYHENAWSAVGKVIDVWGGELRRDIAVDANACTVTGRSLSLVDHLGSSNGLRFEYGHNLTSISRTIGGDVVTAVYAWGKGIQVGDGYGRRLGIDEVTPDGMPYVHDDEALQTWGLLDANGNRVHAFGEYVNQNCEDPHQLMAEARADLDARKKPRVSYSASVRNFAQAGTDLSGCTLGDTVQVVDKSFTPELRVEARVVDLKTDLLDPSSTKITLGNYVETIADDINSLAKASSAMVDRSAAWEAASSGVSSYMERVIGGLNTLFDGAGGYVTMDPATGITIMNAATKDAATMAMQLNGAGFRIANTKKADGEWDWRTFGTGAGFVADLITAGRLQFGSNYIDMESGEMELGGYATSLQLSDVDTKAVNAASAASAAQTTANSASSAASAASTAAGNAAKVATNYMSFNTSNGLVVGDMTASTLGYNLSLKSTIMAFRSGSTDLATFAANLIELGKNAVTSAISFCADSMRISATRSTTFVNGFIDMQHSASQGSGLTINAGRGTSYTGAVPPAVVVQTKYGTGRPRSSLTINNSIGLSVFGTDASTTSNYGALSVGGGNSSITTKNANGVTAAISLTDGKLNITAPNGVYVNNTKVH